jgi:hypothetical protein
LRRLSAAERLLQNLGVTQPEEIDVEAIAWNVGAEVRYSPLQSCEARIIGFGEKAIVTIDTGRSWPRQRFSIGHELGHWEHHRGRSSICRSDEIGNQSLSPVSPERVADAYSADLLLPRYLFEPMARQFRRINFAAVDQLRGLFQTSITATALRIVDLGPVPAMLICHTKSGRKWFHPGRDVPNRWFPRADLDVDSSAFEVQFGNLERSRQSLVGADAWFDRPEAERYELLEQNVRTVDGETLTLLVFQDERMLED